MNALLMRNLRVFFRDKASVFFSLLSVIIIVLLYAVFLGDSWASSDMFMGRQGARWLMDCWVMAGLLAVVSVTATMGAYGIMVDDKVRKINKDFYSSPLSRTGLTGGYILGAFSVGLIISLVTVALAIVYITLRGGAFPVALALIKTLGLVVASTLSNTAMVLFLVSFIKSQNAFGTASALIGTLIGFLTGIYMPIGQLPPAVQTIIKFIPTSHAAALFRQVLMEEPMKMVFAGAPEAMAEEFRAFAGAAFTIGGHTFTAAEHLLVLAGTFVLFSLLSLLVLSRKKS